MFGKQLISQSEARSEVDGFIILKYYLVWKKSETAFSNEAVNSVCYGVLVEKSQEGVCGIWQDCIEGVSYDKDEAINLIERLAQGLVTPDSLVYIVDDYISEIEIEESIRYDMAN